MQTSRSRASIAVIGDGGVPPGANGWLLAERLGLLIVEAGHRVVTGGLGGVMEAACRGARGAPAYRHGDTVGILPGHDASATNGFVDVAIPTGLGHARNLVVAHADAVVAIGGGAGTLSELAMAWIFGRLILGFRVEGWSGRLADQRVDPRIRYPSIPDDRVFGIDTAEEAIAILGARLPDYHAARRVESSPP